MPDRKRPNIYAVLLAGGSGTRLWPVSRELYPKQLVNFIGDDSLVQLTVKRLPPEVTPGRIRIVCGEEHFFEIARHLEAIGIASHGNIIGEPCGRNTAPAILMAALNIFEQSEDAVICVFPADHVIRDLDGFHARVASAVSLAGQGHIVTFGITPHYPETGYGYIEGDRAVAAGALSIRRFVEKPDRQTAMEYLDAGNYFWNSGMFVFKASVIIEEFKTFEPELYRRIRDMRGAGSVTREAYEQLKNISIDVAIMERTQKGVVLPSDFGWSDIGSWKSLYDFLPKDSHGNVIDGDVISNDTENCFIMGHERLIATNSIRDMVVVETPDSVFVSDIDSSRNVKTIVEQLKRDGRKEYKAHQTVHHPWGVSTRLENRPGYQIVRLAIYPDSKLRIEALPSVVTQLVILEGRARINGDGRQRSLDQGQTFMVSGTQPVDVQPSDGGPLCLLQIQISPCDGKGQFVCR
ncbi:MAG: mannose-1-phosphate guanylyltransferase/mannose-6-phosphate isomerase [Desulfobacterales bacterium]|nr:mannose-1-phosphate guanylyltransferase/mannose-6-phosphate isomerase [Desulfobacterales bacterium]MDD4073817.1 mannose-1-phosphate guanylyltransferase/mannose-6-phosphate isomerase [Desulfobacterales bacterium]MDD4391143.1 mannose-1-phosphate guanylyltransferase/mannose-6-phosphate isomerase [Desulfobacterales bacterium]